jgi:lipoprotein-anchoring transpeptidase ErfK/SrfK
VFQAQKRPESAPLRVGSGRTIDSENLVTSQIHSFLRRRAPAGAALLLACAALSAQATPPSTAPPPPTAAPALAPAPRPAVVPVVAPAPAATELPVVVAPVPTVLGTEPLAAGQFAWQPQFSTGGPLLVVVNIREQVAYVYRNGLRIGRSSVSTGKEGHETPTGVFTILEKNREHYSSIYNNAPMPFMQRLTWDGVALHAGKIPGYPASHGCVRLPYAFSELLFGATSTGVTVVIANDGATPTVVASELIAPSTLSARLEAAWAGTWTWEPSRAPEGAVTIVLSTREQVAHVLRNGTEIGRARISVKGELPTETTAYVLLDGTTGEPSQIAPGRAGLRWEAVGDATQTERIGPLASEFISRLGVPADFARNVYDILEPGAAVVITAETLTRDDSLTALTVLRADQTPTVAAAAPAPVATPPR